MKNPKKEVIDFLKALKGSPEEQFNIALNLYRNSPNANAGIVRYNNVSGFSAERLETLIYDLKKAYEITPADLATAAKVVKLNSKSTDTGTNLPAGFPEFSKGAKGNAERKAYLKSNGLTSADFKSATMDAVIIQHLKDEADKVADEALVEEVKTELSTGNEISIELQEKLSGSSSATKEIAEELITEALSKLKEPAPEGELQKKVDAFQKVVDVLKAGEEVPISLVREIFEDKDMTDADAESIIKQAKDSIPNFEVDAKNIKASGTDSEDNGTENTTSGTEIPKNDTDVSKNGTDVSENETKAEETETTDADSEKK